MEPLSLPTMMLCDWSKADKHSTHRAASEASAWLNGNNETISGTDDDRLHRGQRDRHQTIASDHESRPRFEAAPVLLVLVACALQPRTQQHMQAWKARRSYCISQNTLFPVPRLQGRCSMTSDRDPWHRMHGSMEQMSRTGKYTGSVIRSRLSLHVACSTSFRPASLAAIYSRPSVYTYVAMLLFCSTLQITAAPKDPARSYIG